MCDYARAYVHGVTRQYITKIVHLLLSSKQNDEKSLKILRPQMLML